MVRIALAPTSPFSVTTELMARDGRARARPRRAAAHAPGRDRRRGGVLPRALRQAPARVPRGPRLARRRRLARALRAPRRRRVRADGRDRHRRRALPDVERAARRRHRAGARRCWPRARRSGSASTARRRTSAASWSTSCAPRWCSRASSGGPAALTARDALELATRHGARCLGRDDELGHLSAGAVADVALWDLREPGYAGIADPVAALAFGPTRPSTRCSSAATSWSRTASCARPTR